MIKIKKKQYLQYYPFLVIVYYIETTINGTIVSRFTVKTRNTAKLSSIPIILNNSIMFNIHVVRIEAKIQNSLITV